MKQQHQLLALCERVHMHLHGSGDPMTSAEVTDAEKAMRERLATWTSSPPKAKEYDDAVRVLVVATLREIYRAEKEDA